MATQESRQAIASDAVTLKDPDEALREVEELTEGFSDWFLRRGSIVESYLKSELVLCLWISCSGGHSPKFRAIFHAFRDRDSHFHPAWNSDPRLGKSHYDGNKESVFVANVEAMEPPHNVIPSLVRLEALYDADCTRVVDHISDDGAERRGHAFDNVKAKDHIARLRVILGDHSVRATFPEGLDSPLKLVDMALCPFDLGSCPDEWIVWHSA